MEVGDLAWLTECTFLQAEAANAYEFVKEKSETELEGKFALTRINFIKIIIVFCADEEFEKMAKAINEECILVSLFIFLFK